jgi:hypothetical protein
MAKDHYYDHSLNAHDPCVTARVSSPGLFFIYFGWNGYSYSHQTDHNATVSGSGTTRTASYAGTVSLWQVNPAPKKPTRVGSSFYCPFRFTLTEHAGTPGFYEHDCLLPLLWYIPSFTLLPIAHAERPRVEKRSWQQIGSSDHRAVE